MSATPPAASRTLSLEELIALNAEIAALTRAGIPLEHGLGGLRGGRGGTLVERLRQQLERGVSLPEAFAGEAANLPPAYRAVVEAGLRTGRLPAALETIAEFAEVLLELRRRVRLALIYPAIVVAVAYLLFWLFLTRLAGPISETYRLFGLEQHTWVALLEGLEQTAVWWLTIPPLLLFVGLTAVAVARPIARGPGGAPVAGLGWLPGIGGIVRQFRWSTFAELLAMLLERQIGLSTALRLAGDAVGDARIASEAGRLSADVEAGRTLAASLRESDAFPPFMRWMMGAGEQQQALPASLRQLAEIYRRRGLHRADWLRFLLPIGLAVFVGGGVVLSYALLLFLPLKALLESLGRS